MSDINLDNNIKKGVNSIEIIFYHKLPIFGELKVNTTKKDKQLEVIRSSSIIKRENLKILESIIGKPLDEKNFEEYIQKLINSGQSIEVINQKLEKLNNCKICKEIFELYNKWILKKLSWCSQIELLKKYKINKFFDLERVNLYTVNKLIEVNKKIESIEDNNNELRILLNNFRDFLTRANSLLEMTIYRVRPLSLVRNEVNNNSIDYHVYTPIIYLPFNQLLERNLRIYFYPFQHLKMDLFVEFLNKSGSIRHLGKDIEFLKFDIKSSILKAFVYNILQVEKFKSLVDTYTLNEQLKSEILNELVFNNEKDLYKIFYKDIEEFLYSLRVNSILTPQQYDKLIYFLKTNFDIENENKRKFFKRSINEFLNCAKDLKKYKFLEFVNLVFTYIEHTLRNNTNTENKNQLKEKFKNLLKEYSTKKFNLFYWSVRWYKNVCVKFCSKDKILKKEILYEFTNYQIKLNFEIFLKDTLYRNKHLLETQNKELFIVYYNFDGFIYLYI